MPITTLDNRNLLKEIIADKTRFLQTFTRISDKSRRLVPFVLNPIQAHAFPICFAPSARVVVVKPAQVGFSTAMIAGAMLDTMYVPGTVTVVIAHEEFMAERLLSKAQAIYDSVPEAIRPRMGHGSSYEKTFPDINSAMYISSARSFVVGRGENIHNLLCDEYAFWPDQQKVMGAILPRVTDTGRVLYFSTANGEDNPHTVLYRMAQEPNSGRIPLFYPWFVHPEYTMTITNDHAKRMGLNRALDDLNTDEQRLVDLHSLTEDQIRWRRYKKKEMESASRRTGANESGIIATFEQEYPEDDITCFRAAGDMVYDQSIVDSLDRKCTPPISIHPYTTIKGHANIWVEPVKNRTYLIGMDPGVGRECQTAITAWYFDRDPEGQEYPIHCATDASYDMPEEAAKRVVELARYYNNATIAPEANSHGLALIACIRGYGNIYYRRDIISGRISKELGWLTTPRTKPYMISEMMRMLPFMDCKDSLVVSQLRNIRQHGVSSSGQLIVKAVGMDDLHDSMAVAIVCRGAMPLTRGVVGHHGR